jgi:hypothetical protein
VGLCEESFEGGKKRGIIRYYIYICIYIYTLEEEVWGCARRASRDARSEGMPTNVFCV